MGESEFTSRLDISSLSVAVLWPSPDPQALEVWMSVRLGTPCRFADQEDTQAREERIGCIAEHGIAGRFRDCRPLGTRELYARALSVHT